MTEARDVIAKSFSWHRLDRDASLREADAILSSLDAAGFAVMPKDPTKEMLGAGATSLVNDQDHKGVPQMAVSPAYGAYKAMLKAAQEANHG